MNWFKGTLFLSASAKLGQRTCADVNWFKFLSLRYYIVQTFELVACLLSHSVTSPFVTSRLRLGCGPMWEGGESREGRKGGKRL